MPFLAPILGAAIGGIAATSIGTAVIGAGLSLGIGYLARRLQPKPNTQPQGSRLSLRLDANEPREVAFGTVAVAGTLKYHHSYGPNGNDYVQLVFALLDHECDGLSKIYVDGVECTLGSDVTTAAVSGQTVSGYDGVLWVKFHSGAWTQAADTDLVAKRADGEWPSTFRGRGVCYVRVTMKADPEKFKNGQPRFLFVVRGMKLYDWRKDSTNGGSGAHRWGDESTYQYSDNPFVQAYNFRRGIFVNGSRLGGMNTPASSLPVDEWTAAANASDELVSLKAGGTEKRYRSNGIWQVSAQHRETLREIITAAAGIEVESGGVFKPYAGVAQSPVMSMTDADIMAQDEVRYTPKLSRAQLVNSVFGSYSDPAQNYEAVALPPRISPADEAFDGGVQLQEHYGLTFVTSGTQGQRVVEILRRKGRFQRRVTLRLRSRFAVLEAGDWVPWTSARYGFEDMLFEVVQATLNRDLTVSVELKETSVSIYGWTPAVDELDPQNPRIVQAGGSTFTTVQGVDLDNVTVTYSASARPGLNITWEPITDATVTDLLLEYRKVGDTVALGPITINDPSTGTYTWVTGVQGGVEYEARLKPKTLPVRPVVWTGWVSSGDNSAGQTVAVAAYAETVNPAGLPPAILSAQDRFELSLIFETDAVLGSASQMIADTVAFAERSHSAVTQSLIDGFENKTAIRVEQRERQTADTALAEQITSVLAQVGTNAALVQSQLTAIATDLTTQADLIQTVSTAVDGQTAQVTVLSQSINGIEAKFGVAVSANGEVLGLVQLDVGAVAGSTFTVVADNFRVSRPGTAGGAAVPVFAIQTVGGVAKLALRGDMLADGTITANKISVSQLSAFVADLGVVTAGSLRNPANTVVLNLATMYFGRTDRKGFLDLLNGRLYLAP